MIAHALHIIVNELNRHLDEIYGAAKRVDVGNIGLGLGDQKGQVKPDFIIVTLVNYKEEKALKNLPNYSRNDTTLKVTYENAPVYLNFMVCLTATHQEYASAILYLSRVIRFFQSQNVFTQDNVAPASILSGTPLAEDKKDVDSLESFKLIMDLYSPTMEEVNHLWGTLGGKQYPFVLYMLRMLDLKYRVVQSESGLITEIQSDFYHKNTPDK